MTISPPPMTAIHATGSTSHELKAQRRAERNEKARLRMARKRAELKSRPLEEQRIAAKRTKAYQATYREKCVRTNLSTRLVESTLMSTHSGTATTFDWVIQGSIWPRRVSPVSQGAPTTHTTGCCQSRRSNVGYSRSAVWAWLSPGGE
ncbi:hypothetical protein DFH08DRAFT_814461 [Mycena albidolilacea]|uniref:Uncharacterized protein n=1 Tax=Mycena albidolilacea TaxID=1033008 RepID=A0AAD6ZPV6_9AGAR|nr:hypothetical protein DFH08DRAFT_814461 [Mycena albidolilacea]